MNASEPTQIITADFILVSNDAREFAFKDSDTAVRSKTPASATFGQVTPILSSGEWSEDEFLQVIEKTPGLWQRFVSLFYS